MALRIRKVADQNDVPILERPQLARDLYAGVEIGQVIPERFLKQAEILAYVYRLREEKIEKICKEAWFSRILG